MRVPQKYLLSLATTYGGTNFILAYYSATLDLCVCVFTVEYFVLEFLYSPPNPKTQRIINAIGYLLFAVFVLIVTLRVLTILGANFI